MSRYDLDDEQRIADERERGDCLGPEALCCSLEDLPELQPVVAVDPTTTVRVAIEEMVSKRVGCVLVMEDGLLVGVFSERDVLSKVAISGIDVNTTAVSELMTQRPETLAADNELVYALHKMVVGGYRHVPMLSGDGKPVNVVSMRDIVGYLVSLYPTEVLNLPDADGPRSNSREGA